MSGHGQFFGMDREQCDVVRGMILPLNTLYLDEWRTWSAKARELRWAGEDRDEFMERLAHIDRLLESSSEVFGDLSCRLSEECDQQDAASAPDEPGSPFPFPFPRPGGNRRSPGAASDVG